MAARAKLFCAKLDAPRRQGHGRAMADLSIRIDFESGHMLGPGMIELLERVGEHGSIRQAAASMAMSYRKAWLLIRGLEESFGGAVVNTATGGSAGGGANLTALGQKLIESYRRIEANAARAGATDLKALSALVRAGRKQ